MTILITNDDGIHAEGIVRLAEAAKNFGEVFVVAPDSQRSAASHSISLHSHIDAFPHEFPVPGVTAWASTGTPSDCVRIGCLSLLPRKPDVVLSGINYGYNTGTDLQYSATAGAAFEGAFQGCLAISLSEEACDCHEAADAWLLPVLRRLFGGDTARTLEWGQILNVNFPGCPLAECRGILENRTVSRGTFYHDRYELLQRLPGRGVRLMVKGHYNEDAEEGSDMRAVVDGYVSVGVVSNLG